MAPSGRESPPIMNRHRSQGRKVFHPGLESLEGRSLPAQFGVPWHDAIHLSVSFMPDGTPIGSDRSDLFRTLNAEQTPTVWQRQILRAFQNWAIQAHVNVSFTTDGGQPMGISGPDQHDPRFGDIRIGARPMSPEVLSISVPHDPFLSGTLSGDVLLNDTVSFGPGNAHLFPILLHEAGHVLGLDHRELPASVMNENLDPSRATLAPSDIAALQDLYGTRPADSFEGAAGNDTLEAAVPFSTPAGYDGSTPLLLYADITTAHDRDFFSFQAPSGYQGPATIRLQTAGVSLLEPRLTVYDASGQVVSEVASQTIGGDTLQLTLPQLDPDATYHVEASGATGDLFGIGEYVLAISYDTRSTVGADAIDRLARQAYSYLSPDDINAIFLDPQGALFHDDHHADDTFATAAPLKPAGVYGSEAPARITASLGDRNDVDVYAIETPEESDEDALEQEHEPDEQPLVMTVTGRVTEVNGLMPRVAVFDEDGHHVAAQVLAHGGGTYTIQVANVPPDTHFFIRVEADPSSGQVVGNYDLDVEYGHAEAHPTSFVSAALNGHAPQQAYQLVVNQTQLFDFLLATSADASPGSAVQMTVSESTGQVVATRFSEAGQTTGGDPLLLPPGLYQVTFTAVSDSGIPIPNLTFRLYGASLSDPIGPAPDDPTHSPLAAPTILGPAAVVPPVLGASGAPYTWLALTLDGSRGDRSTPDVPGVQSFVGLSNDKRTRPLLGDPATLFSLGTFPAGTATEPTTGEAVLHLASSSGAQATIMGIQRRYVTGPSSSPLLAVRPDCLAPSHHSRFNNGSWPVPGSGVEPGTPRGARPKGLTPTGEGIEPVQPSKPSFLQPSRADQIQISADPDPADQPVVRQERSLQDDLASMITVFGIATLVLVHGRIRLRRQDAIATGPGGPRMLYRRNWPGTRPFRSAALQ